MRFGYRKGTVAIKKLFAVLLIILQFIPLVSCRNTENENTGNVEEMLTTTSLSAATSRNEAATSESTEDIATKVSNETTGATELGAQGIEQSDETEQLDFIHQHCYTASQFAASCEDHGYTLYSCDCGSSYKDNYTAALGHNYAETVVVSTSSDQGYTEHTCRRCGNSYKDSYTDPVKIIYSTTEAQQIGNGYINRMGYTVDESLIWGNAGYYPPEMVDGNALDLPGGGQVWLNQRAIDGVRYTIDCLIASERDGDISGARMFCAVTYNEVTDIYTICVYYG